ncbi:MAG: nitroreductase family protein [Actinomycetota bacterium]
MAFVDDAPTFGELLQLRHSQREFASETVPDVDVDQVLSCARRFAERCGFTAPRILALPRGTTFDCVAHAAVAGLGVNMWLRSTPASHLLLCATVPGEDLTRAVEEAAMCMQVAILAATELGYGTCWMSGINHDRVEQVHRLPDGARLVAISPLGNAPGRPGWRDVPRHQLLKDRKPLDEVTMREVWQ